MIPNPLSLRSGFLDLKFQIRNQQKKNKNKEERRKKKKELRLADSPLAGDGQPAADRRSSNQRQALLAVPSSSASSLSLYESRYERSGMRNSYFFYFLLSPADQSVFFFLVMHRNLNTFFLKKKSLFR